MRDNSLDAYNDFSLVNIDTQDDLNTVPKVINQFGNDSININNVENLSLTQNITQSNTRISPVLNNANCTCFNPIVGTDFDLDGDFVFTDKSRFLEYGDDHILTAYKILDEDTIEKIKRFPTIIANENTEYGGETDSGQTCIYGFITDIKPQGQRIKVYFEARYTVNQRKLSMLSKELDFGEKGITELNRSHWLIKGIDLIDVLNTAEENIFTEAINLNGLVRLPSSGYQTDLQQYFYNMNEDLRIYSNIVNPNNPLKFQDVYTLISRTQSLKS